MQTRKLVAESVGTFFLVFFAVGVATLSFGFKFAGASVSAGVVTTALCLRPGPAGPGLHPRAHLRAATSTRPSPWAFWSRGGWRSCEAIGFWIAQFVGGIAGALVLWGVISGSPFYSRQSQGSRRRRVRARCRWSGSTRSGPSRSRSS